MLMSLLDGDSLAAISDQLLWGEVFGGCRLEGVECRELLLSSFFEALGFATAACLGPWSVSYNWRGHRIKL